MELSRREFIGLLASLGVSAAAVGLLKQSGLLDKLELLPSPQALEEARNNAQRPWGMVIDLSKCIGCNACVINCKICNEVPRGVFTTKIREVEVRGTQYYLPLLCQQCQNAPCVKVCPTGASYYTDCGCVCVDPTKCIGCKTCMAVCPYMITDENGIIDEHGPPRWVDPRTGRVNKCDFCNRCRENGVPEVQSSCFCVLACPAGARIFGDFNDPLSPVSKALRARKFSFRLKEHLGTDPRVYYVGREVE